MEIRYIGHSEILTVLVPFGSSKKSSSGAVTFNGEGDVQIFSKDDGEKLLAADKAGHFELVGAQASVVLEERPVKKKKVSKKKSGA